MTLRWLTPIFALLCVACGGTQSYQWDALELDEQPDKKAHPSADRVVLLDTMDVHYESDAETGKPVAVVTRVRRVRTFIGIEQQLESFDARLIQPPLEDDGKPAKKTLAKDKSVQGPLSGNVVYSSTKGVVLDMKAARPGSVYEQRTVHRVTSPRMWPVFQVFSDAGPVLKGSLTVSAPSDWSVQHVAQEMGGQIEWAPATETTAGRTQMTWVAENVPQLFFETGSPSHGLRGKNVGVRLASWKENGQAQSGAANPKALSAYYAELAAKPVEELDPALKVRSTKAALEKQVDELLAGVPDDPRAKAHRLYDWVRQNIRYISVNLGLGGWVPTPSQETRARLYGDCKDKANLLKDMLAYAGIKSRLGLLHATGEGFRFPYGLPTLAGNANHAILIIDLPDGPVFADPTARSAAFGTLPFMDQGAPILPISDAGDDLVTTPESTAAQNWREVGLVLNLEADGSVEGEFVYSALGSEADGVRAGLIDTPEAHRGRVLTSVMDSDVFTVGELNAIEALEPPDAKTPIVASGLLAATNMLPDAGSVTSIRLADLVDRDTQFLSPIKAKRTSPVLVGARRQLRARVKVTLGDGLTAGALPAEVNIESPFGKARVKWALADGVLTMERDVENTVTQVAADKAAEYREFLTRIQRASATPVILKRGGGS